MNDKLLILEDTDGDGKADKCTVFADDLHNPTGFEFWNGGVLVAQAPDLLFLKDTDGDDKADVRERVISGLDSADTHHTSNSFTLDPGGALYFQEGTFHHTQVETPYGPPRALRQRRRLPLRAADAEVRGLRHPTASPTRTATSSTAGARTSSSTAPARTRTTPPCSPATSTFPTSTAAPPQVYQQRTRPCPGIEYLSSRHFPDDDAGQPAGRQRDRLPGHPRSTRSSDKGAELRGTEARADRSRRPTRTSARPTSKIGPDGALYFIDWHNPIIGHMQHNLRDPSRDRDARPRLSRHLRRPAAAQAGRRSPANRSRSCSTCCKEPEDRVRYRARIELGSRDDATRSSPRPRSGSPASTRRTPNYEHHLLEGLWLHQNHNVVNVDLLKRVLASPDFRARAAATRVLCYWRDRVPDALDLLKKLAADAHPRVRLEAVRAASFFTVPEAVEVPLIAAEQPAGQVSSTSSAARRMKALDPFVKKAIADGQADQLHHDAGARFFLRNVGTDDLLKMKRTPGVYLELLFRKGVRDEFRREALAGLAKQREQDRAAGAARRHPEPGRRQQDDPGRES